MATPPKPKKHCSFSVQREDTEGTANQLNRSIGVRISLVPNNRRLGILEETTDSTATNQNASTVGASGVRVQEENPGLMGTGMPSGVASSMGAGMPSGVAGSMGAGMTSGVASSMGAGMPSGAKRGGKASANPGRRKASANPGLMGAGMPSEVAANPGPTRAKMPSGAKRGRKASANPGPTRAGISSGVAGPIPSAAIPSAANPGPTGAEMPSRVVNFTQKHHKFVDEPMRDKKASDVPGIGKKISQELEEDDMKTAKHLYSKYLMNPNKFKTFIKRYGGNAQHQTQAYCAFKGWDEQHN